MYLSSPCKLGFSSSSSSSSSVSASLDLGPKLRTEIKIENVVFEGTKERIKKLFDKVELSVSAYDTAWVAMVHSPNSSDVPCFPECVNWLLENQHPDGSWGLNHHHPLLIKDALSSTLASILALKRWQIGDKQMNNGLRFIERNFSSVTDEKQQTPVGFDIIFPGMIEYAKDLSLNLPLRSTDIDAMLQRRDMELLCGYGGKLKGRKAYLAYVSEGMQKIHDWKEIMDYQRKNGSIFNSPSTTAAALMKLGNARCLHYLQSLVQKFGNSVPTVYPLDMYARLCMVDSLVSFGIDRHFQDEIGSVLDETYRCWQQGEEDVFSDPTTSAMAFRLLRVNGYDVSSDQLSQYAEEDHFFNSLGGYLKDISAVLELFRASEVVIHPDEYILEKQHLWTSQFLANEVSNDSVFKNRFSKYVVQEVDNALKIPYHANLDSLAHRRKIEHYSTDSTRILKTSYCSPNISNEYFLKLALEDFTIRQSTYREELKQLASWVEEKRLDKLKFARQKLAYCYFSAAATLVTPELSSARISWAKNGVLTTVVDDFFDVGGSKEELVNLIHLIEKWDENVADDCCSEHVEIIFSALHSTISEIGKKASACQDYDVTNHIIKIWLDLLKSMLQEAEWQINKSVPTLDEYMTNGYISFALGPIVVPAVYLVGPSVSEKVAKSDEYTNLYKLMSTCGRLHNDIHSFKRESSEGKLNAVSLYMMHDTSALNEEEAVRKMRHDIVQSRRQLLRLVLQEEGSIVPRACKDLFWKMCKILHMFYLKDDGFTSDHIMDVVKAVIHEPISLNEFDL